MTPSSNSSLRVTLPPDYARTHGEAMTFDVVTSVCKWCGVEISTKRIVRAKFSSRDTGDNITTHSYHDHCYAESIEVTP